MTDWQGRTVVVTGATSGIGFAIARLFAAAGAELHLVGRDPGRMATAAAGLGTESIQMHALDLAEPFDTLPDSLENVASDLLVHSAGAIRSATVREASGADFDLQYRINVRAPWMLSRLLLDGLIARQGQVVFVNSSVTLQKARAGLGAYTASKVALAAVADSLRDEVNEQGVRILSVFPGRTATPMQEDLHRDSNQPFSPEKLLQPDDIAELVMHTVSLPRTAEVTDIGVRPMQKG